MKGIQRHKGCAFDNNNSVVLLLLDLRQPSTQLIIPLLLSRLALTFGVNGQVIAWIKSFLKDRERFVQIENTKSSICQFSTWCTTGCKCMINDETVRTHDLIAPARINIPEFCLNHARYTSFESLSQFFGLRSKCSRRICNTGNASRDVADARTNVQELL